MQVRRVALIGSSEGIYNYVKGLNLDAVERVKHVGRKWEAVTDEIIHKTDKSYASISIKLDNVEYIIQPQNSDIFKSYLEYFNNENEYVKDNDQGTKYPTSFLWPNEAVICLDVPEKTKLAIKENCQKAGLDFIDHTPTGCLASIGTKAEKKNKAVYGAKLFDGSAKNKQDANYAPVEDKIVIGLTK